MYIVALSVKQIKQFVSVFIPQKSLHTLKQENLMSKEKYDVRFLLPKALFTHVDSIYNHIIRLMLHTHVKVTMLTTSD